MTILKTTRLHAFTVMELVVALLISSIVVSILYFSYSLIVSQLGRRLQQSERINEYILFQGVLERDFERAQQIRDSSQGGSKYIILRGDNGSIRYLIDTGWVCRDRDTFRLKGGRVEIGYFSDSLLLITDLKMRFIVNGDQMSVRVRKDYSGRELLEADAGD